MNRLLRQLIIYLIFRIDWRKLILLCCVFTTAGVIVQIYTLPYPLTVWILSPQETALLNQSLNRDTNLSEKFSVSSTPVPFVQLGRVEMVETLPAVITVPKNTSTDLNQKVPTAKEIAKASRRERLARRRQRKREARRPKIMFTPPTPPRRPVSDEFLRYIQSLEPHDALVYAKKEMENISALISDPDPDLHAPLFRNVSTFERSYELMELILKVFIYPDGKMPIFHVPNLQGIYASEGWFMMLMVASTQFVTKDPEKAHLFYMPYSARQLQTALYVPGSHDIRKLSLFLRDHVNMLAAKYPFWNRTHGSDHFLVACHDWGPYTLTEHEELTQNTIKALCNADASEGIFKAGKDVSLPETTIRNPQKPIRGVGGKRVSQRPILAFFAGNMHGRVRPTLLKYWGDKDDDMRIYGPLPNRVSRKMSYIEHMKSSKYCICPMGYEVNSPRIVEALYYECVPVIIADNFVPPLNDVLDWSSFSLIVAEKDIPKLKEILLAIPLRRYLKIQGNVKMVQKHFHWSWRPVRYDMFHMILHSIWNARLNQIQIPQST